MKDLIIILRLIVAVTICYHSNLIAQWYDVSSNLPSYWSWTIDAIDSLTAIGPIKNDSIYITTDAGLTWNPISYPIVGTVDISMVTTEKIWVCTCGFGKIYATSDGGENWQLQFDDTSLTSCMNYIEMFDSLNGVAMGDAPIGSNEPALFLRTTDGGNNWISMNQNYLLGLFSGDLWRRVDFVDMNTGYFFSSGESPKKLYKTTNGGADWEVVNDTCGWTQVLKFYDENFGLVYPSPNGIYRTTDGGATWEDITIPFHYWGHDIEFAPSNPSKIWFASHSQILFSTDSGSTWTEQANFEYGGFEDLIFTDEENGWLLGNHIYRTTNGGVGGIVSVEENIENFKVSEFTLEQNFPNPFNPSTRIKYSVPQTEKVVLKVFDILGNEIEALVNEEKQTGTYEVTWYAERLPSGVYFYQIKAGSIIETKKMVLMK